MFKFENVGQAIKNIAKWAFIIEAIGCVIAGIGMLIAEGTDYIIAALLLICLGPFVAYASVLVLYGFGILVENAEVSLAKEKTKTPVSPPDNLSKQSELDKSSLPKVPHIPSWECPHCNHKNPLGKHKCEKCGKS